MDEREFRRHSEEALTNLHRLLAVAADDYGFGVSVQDGALTVRFEAPPVTIQAGPHRQTRQSGFPPSRRLTSWTGTSSRLPSFWPPRENRSVKWWKRRSAST